MLACEQQTQRFLVVASLPPKIGKIGREATTGNACFSMCFYIHAGFRFELISGNLTAQSMWSHWKIGGRIQISETYMWL